VPDLEVPSVVVERSVAPDPSFAPRTSHLDLESGTGGRWEIALDPWTGYALEGRRAVVPDGPPATRARAYAEAERFRQRHATLLGAAGATLQCVRNLAMGRAWHVTWQQTHAGILIDGAILDCVLSENGAVVAFTSRLVRPPRLAMPPAATDHALAACAAALGRSVVLEATESTWVPIASAAGWECVPASRCFLADASGGRWDALVDPRSDRILALESRIRHVAITGLATAEALPRYAYDLPEARALAWLDVQLAAPARLTVAAADGSFAFDALAPGVYHVEAGLHGSFVTVRNDAGDPVAAAGAEAAAPGAVQLHFGAESSRLDERTIYVHTTRIHDWARQRFGFESLNFPLPATAAVRNPTTGAPDYANAHYDGQGIHFGNGGTVTFELGLFADVIYHEYTHAITDRMYRPGGGLPGLEGGAIHEGLSDYFACTLTGEPLMGENLFRENLLPYLRNLENTRQWPQDRSFQVHSDGEILAGAFWDMRRLLGPDVADPLVHFARATFPRTFEQYARAVLLQDDVQYGDGAAANGSPHRDAIVAAFAAHGLGPAANVPRGLVHEPLGDTESPLVARRIRAGFSNGLSAPSDSLWLSYSNGGPFETHPMQREADGTFAGEIPAERLTDGAQVRYFLRAAGTRTRQPLFDPPGAPDATHAFVVGEDREPPTIETRLRARAAAFAWPAKLTAYIHDNLGIASAAVEVRHGKDHFWLGLAPGSGAFRDQWEAQFPNIGTLGDVFEYRFVVVDGSRAAHTARMPAEGWQQLELVAELDDGFEAGTWWSHASLVLDHEDPWSLASGYDHTPNGRWAWRAGNDAEEYAAGISAELVTEAYAVGVGARARVWSWLDVEPNGIAEAFDGGFIQARREGEADWVTMVPEGGYTHVVAGSGGSHLLRPGDACLSGRARTWVPLEFDLSRFAGSRVRLRFVFESDAVASPFSLRGWLLDDFFVDPGSGAPTDATLGTGERGPLLAGFPGPSPGRAPIRFRLRAAAAVGSLRLTLFDVRGRLVRSIARDAFTSGAHEVLWDGRSSTGLAAPAGVYYYRLASRWGVERGSFTLVR